MEKKMMEQRGRGRGPEGCLTLDKWMWKMDQRWWWVKLKSFWNGTLRKLATVETPQDSKNPKTEQNFVIWKYPACPADLSHALFFSFKRNKTQSEICPLDLERANILHSGAQCDCFVKVSFFGNKVISTIRENHFCDILKRPVRAT